MNFKEWLSKPAFTAVLLDDASRTKLKQAINPPENWEHERFSHHMTINLGDASNGPAIDWLHKKVVLTANEIGANERAMAVGVITNVPSVNSKKHVTIAINRAANGKPQHSNDITNWTMISPIELTGVVKELDTVGNPIE